jgi:hypothetical protein
MISYLSTSYDRGAGLSGVEPRYYRVSRAKKSPLVDFIRTALEEAGCRILHEPDAAVAPYRFTFETPMGERLGILAYAFFANSQITRNRPDDEHRFQVKYGQDTKDLHTVWQDPYLLYTTVFCGIDPERGIFVGADPLVHSPTRFFISIEYKEHHVEDILKRRWHSWERDRRADSDAPVEVLVGGTKESFLRYIRFEREALGEAQGHRQLLAETLLAAPPIASDAFPAISIPQPPTLHALAEEFQLSENDVLNLIANARRLKMAVRGWVAEEHLVRRLRTIAGVERCERNDAEGHADVDVLFTGVPLRVECKNVLRLRTSAGLARLDFQRTRASKGDPWSRFYSPNDFDVVAACLHAVDQEWSFTYILPGTMDRHVKCDAKLSNNVRIDSRWSRDASAVLTAAARQKN